MIKNLEPYLKHIGNCQASDLCPIDEICICGLRQVYHKLTINITKMQSITRYVQRLDTIVDGHELYNNNLNAARDLARGM